MVSEIGKGRFHKIDKSFFILGEESGAWQIRFWYKNNTVKEKMIMVKLSILNCLQKQQNWKRLQSGLILGVSHFLIFWCCSLLFIQQIFIEHLLYVRHCFKYQKKAMAQNRCYLNLPATHIHLNLYFSINQKHMWKK